jgi:hypothetical protein
MDTVFCELNLRPRDWLRILMLLGEDHSESQKIISILKQKKDSTCERNPDKEKLGV